MPELFWSPTHGILTWTDEGEGEPVWWRYHDTKTSLRYDGHANERPADAVRLLTQTFLEHDHEDDEPLEFVRLIENNEHEGESWAFWLQWQGNQEALRAVGRLITRLGLKQQYDLALPDDETVTLGEDEVDLLVQFGGSGGYMASNIKCTGALELVPRHLDEPDDEYLDRLLYKGGLVRLFHE
jgi:hypothetical protein